jgi:hypothetical protein
MPQAIPGVSPAQTGEVTIMTVWPSLAAAGIGRLFGRMYAIDAGIRPFGVPITVGRLIALATSPLMAAIYFLMRLPRVPFVLIGLKNGMCWHYRLTNRRVVMENPFRGGEIKSVALDRFDSIEVVVQPGQAWYKAGDLVFRQGQTETFRIEGVPRPETFRQTCLKAHQSFVGVAQARSIGAAV